jgi:hypothetical protein
MSRWVRHRGVGLQGVADSRFAEAGYLQPLRQPLKPQRPSAKSAIYSAVSVCVCLVDRHEL